MTESKSLKIDIDVKQRENDEKIGKWTDRAKMYYEDNGKNAPNPIVMDKDGSVHWLNRKQRREQARRRKKQFNARRTGASTSQK